MRKIVAKNLFNYLCNENVFKILYKRVKQMFYFVLFTISMESINGESSQSFSGNLCSILPVLTPPPK